MKSYIKHFSEISIADVPVVGGKNASLGEMYNKLSLKGVPVPEGFATTALAFKDFLIHNSLDIPLHDLMVSLDKIGFSNLKEMGDKARKLILKAELPGDFRLEVVKAYKNLCRIKTITVAVRSSATAEDLPQASFAGQHESYLNVKNEMSCWKQ